MTQNRSVLRFRLSPDNVERLEPENAKEVESLKLDDTKHLFGEKSVQEHLSIRLYLNNQNI